MSPHRCYRWAVSARSWTTNDCPTDATTFFCRGLCRVEIEELNEATDEWLYRLGRLSPMVDTEAAQHDRPEARLGFASPCRAPVSAVCRWLTICRTCLTARKHPWMPSWISWPTHFFEKILTEVNTSLLHSSGTHGFVASVDASHQRGCSTTDGRSGARSTGSRELMPSTWGLNLCGATNLQHPRAVEILMRAPNSSPADDASTTVPKARGCAPR